MMEMAPNSIALMRLPGFHYMQVNDTFCRKTGYRRKEIIGRTPAELNLYADPLERQRLTQALLHQTRVDGIEVRFQSRNGQFYDSLVSLNPVRYKGEACLLAMTVDITARKQAEQELDLYRQHLEEMVQSRTKELQAAQMELIKREKLSILGQLTATVSHELRNPLGVIRSSNFYLQRRVKDKDDKIDKHFKRIEEQIALCDAIVADLLEFTRGRNITIVQEALDPWLEVLVLQISENEGIGIKLDLSKNLPMVPHDRDKIRRVILNVLDNAVQAVKARRSATSVDIAYEPKIELCTEQRENHVLIQITDNGNGMNKETLDRAFEPLFTTRARGTGIGLANVKKIVEEHGGSVALESEIGEGTRMTISLPCM